MHRVDRWQKSVVSLDDLELKPRKGIRDIRVWELIKLIDQ
jgi:hypothetical protein